MAEDYHPDKTMHLGKRLRELANLEMTRINKAKEVLLDPVKRKKYDDYLDGKMTDGVEDILLEVDPFEEYKEENWEELREEILEVEPIDEFTVEREPEPEVYTEPMRIPEPEPYTSEAADWEDIKVIRRPSPTRLPFWGRLKSSVKTYETQGPRRPMIRDRDRGRDRDRDRSTVFRKAQGAGADTRFEVQDQPEAAQRTVITPPPPPPPAPAPSPPPPQQARYEPPADRRVQTRSPEPKTIPEPPIPPPPDDEIKINVIVKLEDEPKTERRRPESKEPQRKPAKKKERDYVSMEPLVMEEIPKDDKDEVMVWKHKEHRSRLRGLEPKNDFKPKYTSPERYLKSTKRRSRADELDDWTEQHRIARYKEEKKARKTKEHKHDMDLDMMEMKPRNLQEEKKKGKGKE